MAVEGTREGPTGHQGFPSAFPSILSPDTVAFKGTDPLYRSVISLRRACPVMVNSSSHGFPTQFQHYTTASSQVSWPMPLGGSWITGDSLQVKQGLILNHSVSVIYWLQVYSYPFEIIFISIPQGSRGGEFPLMKEVVQKSRLSPQLILQH